MDFDVAGFVARADKVRAHFAVLESVRGSGLHDADTDVHGKLCAPQTQHLPGGMMPGAYPEPRRSEVLVAFLDEKRRVYRFFGPDADRAFNLLDGYLETVKKRPLNQLTGVELKLLQELPELDVANGVLVVWQDIWNDILYALYVSVASAVWLPHEEE